MKTISSTLIQKIQSGLTDNSLRISFSNVNIDDIEDENIESESMKLTQAVSDSARLSFGGCISSQLQITLLNTSTDSDNPSYIRQIDDTLKGEWFRLYLACTYDGAPSTLYPSAGLKPGLRLYPGTRKNKITEEVLLFTGFISSIEKDRNDSNRFNITAYDCMNLLMQKSAKPFLDGYVAHPSMPGSEINIEYILDHINGLFPFVVNGSLYFNESSGIQDRTYNTFNFNGNRESWDYGDFTYADLLRWCCEICGLYAVAYPREVVDASGVLGKIEIIELGRGPWDTGSKPNAVIQVYENYEKLEVNEVAEKYSAVTFLRHCTPSSDNADPTIKVEMSNVTPAFVYDMSENPLPYTSTVDGNAGYPCNAFVNYGSTKSRLAAEIPAASITVEGYPWIDPGDRIQIKYWEMYPNGQRRGTQQTLNTYVLKRVLSGCNALTDEITINGGSQTAVDVRS